jgi:hypothetical protein
VVGIETNGPSEDPHHPVGASVDAAGGRRREASGSLGNFELDDLIHRYKRSARELWKFCGQSGASWERAVSMLALLREEGDEPDWWKAGEPRRDRDE